MTVWVQGSTSCTACGEHEYVRSKYSNKGHNMHRQPHDFANSIARSQVEYAGMLVNDE